MEIITARKRRFAAVLRRAQSIDWSRVRGIERRVKVRKLTKREIMHAQGKFLNAKTLRKIKLRVRLQDAHDQERARWRKGRTVLESNWSSVVQTAKQGARYHSRTGLARAKKRKFGV